MPEQTATIQELSSRMHSYLYCTEMYLTYTDDLKHDIVGNKVQHP